MNRIFLTDFLGKQISRNAMCYAWVCLFPFRESAFRQYAAIRIQECRANLLANCQFATLDFNCGISLTNCRLRIASASKPSELRFRFEKT